MAFDGLFMSALTNNLIDKLVGSKIDKVYQPEPDTLILQVRIAKDRYRLYITVNNNMPFITLTENKYENPLTPPMFCMLLRKHLVSGTIKNIAQRTEERVMTLEVDARNELGDMVTYSLIIEIMGKHSNIILINNTDNKIIDSIKRISLYQSRVRQILPGLEFEYLISTKESIKNLEVDLLKLKIDELLSQNKDIEVFKFIYMNYEGFSPNASRDIVYRASLDLKTRLSELRDSEIQNLYNQLSWVKAMIDNDDFSPCIVQEKDSGKYIDILAWEYLIYSKDEYNILDGDIIGIINEYYSKKDTINKFLQKSQSMRKLVSSKIERNKNKLGNLKNDLLLAENADEYKVKGELLLANLYLLEKGMNNVVLDNYYDGSKIKISLDIRLTPTENAQKFFKKYNKLKTAQIEVVNQIEETEADIIYLEQVLANLENTTDNSNLQQIRDELIDSGFINAKKKKGNKRGVAKSKPHHYISDDGFDIYVGKNNIQNDELTLKFASKKDTWLHTKDIAGSHVIIKSNGKEIPKTTLVLAAKLAALHSKGKDSSNVPVDYTLVKHVSKPSGAKFGMVIYVNNKTLYVTPDEKEIERYRVDVGK